MFKSEGNIGFSTLDLLPPPWKNEILKSYQEYLEILNTYTRYQAKSVVVVLGIFLWLMVLVVREWPSITFAAHVI